MTSKYTICPKCGEKNPFKSMVNDRVELERELGMDHRVRCKHCGYVYTASVNDVMARPNPVIIGISVVVSIILTVLIFRLGFIAFLSVALPIIVWRTQEKMASTFNRYRVRIPKK